MTDGSNISRLVSSITVNSVQVQLVIIHFFNVFVRPSRYVVDIRDPTNLIWIHDILNKLQWLLIPCCQYKIINLLLQNLPPALRNYMICETKFIWEDVWLSTNNFRLCHSGFAEHWVWVESPHISLIVLHWHTRALRLGVKMLQDLTWICQYVCSTHSTHNTTKDFTRWANFNQTAWVQEICTLPRAPSGELVSSPSPCSLVALTILGKKFCTWAALGYLVLYLVYL